MCLEESNLSRKDMSPLSHPRPSKATGLLLNTEMVQGSHSLSPETAFCQDEMSFYDDLIISSMNNS